MEKQFIIPPSFWANRWLLLGVFLLAIGSTVMGQTPVANPCPAGSALTTLRPQSNWVATANSTNTTWVASNAIDGNAGTIWASTNSPVVSAANPKTLTINLQAQTNIAGIMMLPRTDYDRGITSYQVHVSNDNVNWVLATSGTWSYPASDGPFHTGAPKTALFNGNSYTARYVRLSATGGTSADPQVAELSILQCNPPAPTVTINCNNFNFLNSGLNPTGAKGLSGRFDANWDVGYVDVNAVANPTLSNVTRWTPAFILNSSNISGLWAKSPYGNAEWISYSSTSYDVDQTPTPQGSPNPSGKNDYFFRFRFNLADVYQLAAFRLQMDFMADNSVWNAYVNGVSQQGKVGGLPQNSSNPYWYGGFYASGRAQLALPHDWQLGVNELVIHVKSANPANGFLAQNITFCAGLDFGDAPASYGVTKAQLAAGHIVKTDVNGVVLLRLGDLLDTELDGTASATANQDDVSGQDDEDGVTFDPICEGSTSAKATVRVYNTNTPDAKLYGWIDWNRNGTFEAAEAATAVAAGTSGTYILTWSGMPAITAGAALISRVRLTSDPSITSSTPNDPAYDGEVEDYAINLSAKPTLTTSVASQTVICSGEVVTIPYTAPASSQVQWIRMPGNVTGFGNVVDAPVAVNNAPTSYTYTARAIGIACPSDPIATVVTVNPVPIVTPSVCSQTICSGQTGNITFISSVPGSTIHWERTPTTPAPASGTGDISQSFINTGPSSLTYTYKIWAESPAPASCPSSTTITCEIVVTPGLEVTAMASSATVCVGSPLSLSASVVPTGNYTYAWTGPGGYVSSDATPTVSASAGVTHSGSYTVVVTDAAGCSGTAVVPVVVANCCSLTATTADIVNVCPGGTITLAVSATGAMGPLSYQWTGPNYTTTTNSATLTIPNATVSQTGNYTVVITDTGAANCTFTDSVYVVVSPVAVSVESNSPQCQGNTVQLMGIGPETGTFTYQWIGPNGFNSTAQNPTIPNATTAATGSYTLVITDTATGCSGTGVTAVSIATQPDLVIAATPSQTICSGQSSAITINGSNGANVTWSNNFGQNGTGTSIDTGVMTNFGTEPIVIIYQATASAGSGVCSDQTSFSVVVLPVPVIQVTPSAAILCDIEQVTIQAKAYPETATLNWTRIPNTPNPPVASGSGTGSVLITQSLPPANYTFQFTATQGSCTSFPQDVTVTVQQ